VALVIRARLQHASGIGDHWHRGDRRRGRHQFDPVGEILKPIAGQFIAWVQIPPPSSANTVIYLFYGNSSITTNLKVRLIRMMWYGGESPARPQFREKAQFVMGLMEGRLRGLGVGWNDVTVRAVGPLRWIKRAVW